MKTISSFTIDHLKLNRGIYVSRVDNIGGHDITTYDIRVTKPNFEPVMNTAEIHTLEHLSATFLRNHVTISNEVIYFGPMGCRTGFYLILKGNKTSKDIIRLVKEMFEFVLNYEGEIPGAKAKECGNYLDMNLDMAKYYAKRFLTEVIECISDENLIYP